jgi:hypothetical protein
VSGDHQNEGKLAKALFKRVLCGCLALIGWHVASAQMPAESSQTVPSPGERFSGIRRLPGGTCQAKHFAGLEPGLRAPGCDYGDTHISSHLWRAGGEWPDGEKKGPTSPGRPRSAIHCRSHTERLFSLRGVCSQNIGARRIPPYRRRGHCHSVAGISGPRNPNDELARRSAALFHHRNGEAALKVRGKMPGFWRATLQFYIFGPPKFSCCEEHFLSETEVKCQRKE